MSIHNGVLSRLARPGLEHLTFSRSFNHALDAVRLPAALQLLTFGEMFNQTLDAVTFPKGLQHLTFGTKFNQSFWVTFIYFIYSFSNFCCVFAGLVG